MLMWKIRKSKILSLHLLFWTMDQLLELQTQPLWHWHQFLLFSEVELFFCLFQSSYEYVDWLLFAHQSSPQSSFVHRLPLLHGFCLHPLLLLLPCDHCFNFPASNLPWWFSLFHLSCLAPYGTLCFPFRKKNLILCHIYYHFKIMCIKVWVCLEVPSPSQHHNNLSVWRSTLGCFEVAGY